MLASRTETELLDAAGGFDLRFYHIPLWPDRPTTLAFTTREGGRGVMRFRFIDKRTCDLEWRLIERIRETKRPELGVPAE